jgi:hypothetical protein
MEAAALAQSQFEAIDAVIATLDPESAGESSVLPLGPNDRLQRVLKVYLVVRPLLTALSLLPLLPGSWRAALALFLETLEALSVAVDGGAEPDGTTFKAGKDLRQE